MAFQNAQTHGIENWHTEATGMHVIIYIVLMIGLGGNTKEVTFLCSFYVSKFILRVLEWF